jgi:hypothetical protein
MAAFVKPPPGGALDLDNGSTGGHVEESH